MVSRHRGFRAGALLAVPLVVLLVGCERVQQLNEARNYGHGLADWSPEDTTETEVSARRDRADRPAELLSAFFGLDDATPSVANHVICPGAAGLDGMPVLFSHEVDLETVQAGDFRVVSASGRLADITCVTLAPADDEGEARTVLVVGQLGSADDQPASVEIIGNLLSIDGQLNFRGAQVGVIPLEAGPTLEWAEIVPEAQWALGKPATRLPFGGGSGCPQETKQVLRVTWAGGVTKPGGQEIDDRERTAYRLKALSAAAQEVDIVPFAMGDLGDGDNNHELCLDQVVTPLAIEFPAGMVTDPREDLNPATRVEFTR